MLKSSFYGRSNTLNIRTVYNMKMRVADILANISQWQGRIHDDNELLAEKSREMFRLRSEISDFRQNADSLFRITFKDAVDKISIRQQTGEVLFLKSLSKNIAIENKIVEINTQVFLFYSDICSLLQLKEASLIKSELPPIWNSPPSVYPRSIWQVLSDSFQQTLESVKYYGEMSLWRIIIFRGMILLLCLIPIKLFSDEQRKKKILGGTNFTFLAKFPKTASVVMGMALSPVIFVHPPHAFLEFILIGLVFTVTMLTFKNYPKLNKVLIGILITSFLVLYLINFFVTPTFPGRLIYVLSIFLLIPLYLTYKQLPSYELEYEKEVRLMLFILAIHLVTGWILVVLGYYTLGRSVILSAYLLLILSMILRIAIYTMLDYLDIIAYFFNKRVKTVKINAQFVRSRSKPLLLLLAGIFLVIAYLFNMNIFDLVKLEITDILLTTRKIGSTSFTLISILLFFISVYLAFLLASLLRHTIDPQPDQTVEKRSSLGSYLLLLRLLILCAGFTVGILASGLPLTNFTILLGAMGVGIGFGLQNIVSNLISGLIIAFERPFVVGDVLEFGDETCKVREISLRATMVSTSDGADILIPNNTLLSENLKNWTISNKQRFLEMKIQAMHSADPAVVTAVIGKCLANTGNIIQDRSIVLLSEINETGLVFTIKILVTDLANASKIRSGLLSEIHTAFHENNIRFPQKNNQQED
jgi:small-conductance mechanosensitive channel